MIFKKVQILRFGAKRFYLGDGKSLRERDGIMGTPKVIEHICKEKNVDFSV